MITIPIWLIVDVTVAVMSAAALLIALMFLTRMIRQNRARRRSTQAAQARLRLLELLDDDDPAAVAVQTDRAFQRAAVDMIRVVRGSERESLVRVMDRLGVIAQARKDLHAHSSAKRAAACELLGTLSVASATNDIAALLADRDSRVRIVAARSLGRSGDISATQQLLDAYQDERRFIPETAVGMAILHLGSQVAPTLRAQLSSSSPSVRALCARLLGQLDDLASSTAVAAALNVETDERAMQYLAQALGRVGLPSSGDLLVQTLERTHSAETKLATINALRTLGAADRVDVLIEKMHDLEYDIAVAASRAVAELAPERLVSLDCCDYAVKFAAATLDTPAPSRQESSDHEKLAENAAATSTEVNR